MFCMTITDLSPLSRCEILLTAGFWVQQNLLQRCLYYITKIQFLNVNQIRYFFGSTTLRGLPFAKPFCHVAIANFCSHIFVGRLAWENSGLLFRAPSPFYPFFSRPSRKALFLSKVVHLTRIGARV